MTVVKFPVVLVVCLLYFFWTFARGEDSVSCDLKKNCILPCSFQPDREVVIHWMTENIPVHSYYYNKDQLGNQNQRFRGRTSLIEGQISSGNASLLLTEVEFQDEGRYKCYTSTIKGNQELFIRLNVDAPVQKVYIEQSEKRIICRSEEIYPKPELNWSTEPPTSLVNEPQTNVQQNGHLYNIISSLTLSNNDTNLNYSCTVSTRKNTRTATLFKLTSISGPESERTIPCTSSQTPLSNFIWKFDYNEIILTQSEAEGPYTASEKWRRYVKDVSETGTLTLQDLSSDQNGIYTCELTSADETLMTNTFLQITEESSHNTAIAIGTVVGVLAVAVVAAVGVLCCKKKVKKTKKGMAIPNSHNEMKTLKTTPMV